MPRIKPRTWIKWGIGTLFVFAFFLFWMLIRNPACELAIKLQESDKYTFCEEFWLNRYQTFAGAIVTLFAAFLAWWAVQQQLRSYDEQAWQVVGNIISSVVASIEATIKDFDELAAIRGTIGNRSVEATANVPLRNQTASSSVDSHLGPYGAINTALQQRSQTEIATEITKLERLMEGCRPIMQIKITEVLKELRITARNYEILGNAIANLFWYVNTQAIPVDQAAQMYDAFSSNKKRINALIAG